MHNLCVRIKGFGMNFHYPPMNVLIGMAGQYLAHIFKDNGFDPSFVLDYKLKPGHSKDGRNMITDMRCRQEHSLYRAKFKWFKYSFRLRRQ